MNISRVDVSCAAPGLDILDESCVEVEANDEIAVWYIETLFCYGSRKETVDSTFTEVHHGDNLLTEGKGQIPRVSGSSTNLSLLYQSKDHNIYPQQYEEDGHLPTFQRVGMEYQYQAERTMWLGVELCISGSQKRCIYRS